MRFGAYIKDKMGWILLNGMGMLLLFAFLLAMGNSLSAIALIFLAWKVFRRSPIFSWKNRNFTEPSLDPI